MATKRKEFTENQKAEIFVRDRATCAFSGISLWLLDVGIRGNWQIDWVDHIKPNAAGGGNNIENGICASNLFNAKKKDNSHDNIYFVKNGAITEHYIKVFSVPPVELVERLERLQKLEPADWFLNRSICGIFVGYNCRCEKEFNDVDYKRTDKYWFKSAWNRLQKFHRKKGEQSILDRGLVKKELPFGTKKLLQLELITNEEEFYNWIEENYEYYRENRKVLQDYFHFDNNDERHEFLLSIEKNLMINPEVKESLNKHHRIDINKSNI